MCVYQTSHPVTLVSPARGHGAVGVGAAVRAARGVGAGAGAGVAPVATRRAGAGARARAGARLRRHGRPAGRQHHSSLKLHHYLSYTNSNCCLVTKYNNKMYK